MHIILPMIKKLIKQISIKIKKKTNNRTPAVQAPLMPWWQSSSGRWVKPLFHGTTKKDTKYYRVASREKPPLTPPIAFGD